MPLTTEFQILVFDYGVKRTGVAVGQSITGQANPLEPLTMHQGQPDWMQVEDLLARWKPDAVLVGLPLNMDGTVSDMALRANKFRQRLHGRFAIAALGWDERLTSAELKREARAQGIHDFGKHSVDSRAAALIFDSWYDALPSLEDWQEHSLNLKDLLPKS